MRTILYAHSHTRVLRSSFQPLCIYGVIYTLPKLLTHNTSICIHTNTHKRVTYETTAHYWFANTQTPHAYICSRKPGKICAVRYSSSSTRVPFVRCHFCFANVQAS